MKIFILKNGPHKNKKSINIRCLGPVEWHKCSADADDSSPFIHTALVYHIKTLFVKYLHTFIPLTVNKNKLFSVGLQTCRSNPSHFMGTKWAKFLLET